MSLLQNSNAISEVGGYAISNSLRFQSASSQYLSRTPASAGNRKTWTWSGWVKRGSISSGFPTLFNAGQNVSAGVDQETQIRFDPSNILEIIDYVNTVKTFAITTSQVFRDPSAWYHIVVAFDTTQATASNRVGLYVNGVQVTSFTTATYPTLNADYSINRQTPHYAGVHQQEGSPSSVGYLDGYLAEVNFIDGQALTPSSFGETDATTGQWIAKSYSGTYGTNGFYLPFSNGTSTTTLGADSSGNGNNWTLNNFTRSAGVSDCWMIDVPSGNGGVSGTQPSSNYCVLNPLNTILPLSNANLTGTQASAAWTSSSGTIAASSGKYYYEASMSSIGGGNYIALGLMLTGTAFNQYAGSNTNSWSVLTNSTNLATYFNAAATNATTISASTSTAFQVAVDIDAGKLWLGYNNNWLGGGNPSTGATPTYTFTANSLVNPIISGYANTVHLNCGQRSFAYTPPTGFKALCTANLPAATIKQGNTVFDATTYTGNNTARSITNAAGFAPDLVWIKDRINTASHSIYDAVRGVLNNLSSNTTGAEASYVNTLTAFNSNGFSLGIDTTYQIVNYSASNYVAWQWDAGSSTVTNTNGSISSQVRANPTAGVSVVTYTGTFVNATVGHGLGIAPSMIIVKRRDSTGAWPTYHSSLLSPATGTLYLNTTNARVATTGLWNSTLPTSSVINIGQNTDSNASGGTYVAYCFAEIAGFSKFGSYTGNGSADGPFVYTGFRPKFIMTKRTDSTSAWVMIDTSRSASNVATNRLYANESSAEDSADTAFDILSNGFKSRTTNTTTNASGGTYIYMAFAENPFAQANAR